MTQARRDLEGLNFLLHGATVLGLKLDPPNSASAIAIRVTTVPKTGPVPVRSTLTLKGVSALVVTLQTAEGETPKGRMAPIEIDGLNELASSYSHSLTGYDFIDSERDSEPRGSVVFEWFEPEVPVDHVLSFYQGMESREGESALLFFRIFFDEAHLTYADGHAIPIDSFAPPDNALGRAIALGSEPGDEAPIKVLPDSVLPAVVNGQVLALVFVDSQLLIRGYAVGKASWDGQRMRWLSPDGRLYDLPDAAAKAIHPRFPEMSMGPKRLDGFDYFTLLPRPENVTDIKEWVAKNLKPSRRWRSTFDLPR